MNIYPKSVTWSGNTWDSDTDTDGVVRVEFRDEVMMIEEGAGNSQRATFVAVGRAQMRMVVVLRHPQDIATDGTSGSMVITLNDGSSDTTCTIAGAVFAGFDTTQQYAQPGETRLLFTTVSTDGSTQPLTIS